MSAILKYPKRRLNFPPTSAFGFPTGTSINFGALDPFRAGVSRNITILAHVHYVSNGGNQAIVSKRNSFAANQNQFDFDISSSSQLSFDKDNTFMNGVNVPNPYFGWLAISTTSTGATTYTSVGNSFNSGNFQTSGGSSSTIPLMIGNTVDNVFFGGTGGWVDAVLLFIGNLPDAFIKAVCVNTQGYNPIGNCPITPVFAYIAESRKDYGQDLMTGSTGAISSGANLQIINSVPGQTNMRGANQTLRAQRSRWVTRFTPRQTGGMMFAA